MAHNRNAIRRVRSYFGVDIWKKSDDRPARRGAGLTRALRVIVLGVRGFFKDGAIHHASALAFDTVLALVPMLAIFFATLKGIGAYRDFVDDTMRPWIYGTFGEAGNDQVGLREAFLQILEFGDRTELAPLGLLGLVLVLWLVALLLNTVETVLNQIWGVQRPRSLARKVADYAAILFVAPFGLFVVTALARWEGSIEWLGPVAHDVIVQVVSILVASAFFAFVFVVMPHTRTRFRSAALGGVVAGVLWYLVLTLYALTQIGVARYNALYSSFAAIPLFLVWVFVSWLVVLFGAEVAAAHHNQTGFRWRVHHHDASPSLRCFLALRLVTLILRVYVTGDRPFTLRALAARAGVPEQLAKDVLDTFVARGYLAEAVVNGRPGYVPARDLFNVRVSEIVGVVMSAPDDGAFAPDLSDDEGQAIARLLEDRDREVAQDERNRTLGELVS